MISHLRDLTSRWQLPHFPKVPSKTAAAEMRQRIPKVFCGWFFNYLIGYKMTFDVHQCMKEPPSFLSLFWALFWTFVVVKLRSLDIQIFGRLHLSRVVLYYVSNLGTNPKLLKFRSRLLRLWEAADKVLNLPFTRWNWSFLKWRLISKRKCWFRSRKATKIILIPWRPFPTHSLMATTSNGYWNWSPSHCSFQPIWHPLRNQVGQLLFKKYFNSKGSTVWVKTLIIWDYQLFCNDAQQGLPTTNSQI